MAGPRRSTRVQCPMHSQDRRSCGPQSLTRVKRGRTQDAYPVPGDFFLSRHDASLAYQYSTLQASHQLPSPWVSSALQEHIPRRPGAPQWEPFLHRTRPPTGVRRQLHPALARPRGAGRTGACRPTRPRPRQPSWRPGRGRSHHLGRARRSATRRRGPQEPPCAPIRAYVVPDGHHEYLNLTLHDSEVPSCMTLV